MADAEELRWLRESANDLNNLLQIIAESSHALEPMCAQQPEAAKYVAYVKGSLERAQKVTSQMAARLGGLQVEETPVGKSPVTLTPAGPLSEPVTVVNPSGDRELILLVDDEEMICELAGEMLSQAGYRVATALNPFRAMQVFRELKDQISLVILDFTLPILDGSEVFDELRSMKPDVAVMLSSGFAEQAKVRAMLAKGLRGFLPKPYTEAKLLSQVRIVLDSIRSERTRERRVL